MKSSRIGPANQRPWMLNFAKEFIVCRILQPSERVIPLWDQPVLGCIGTRKPPCSYLTGRVLCGAGCWGDPPGPARRVDRGVGAGGAWPHATSINPGGVQTGGEAAETPGQVFTDTQVQAGESLLVAAGVFRRPGPSCRHRATTAHPGHRSEGHRRATPGRVKVR